MTTVLTNRALATAVLVLAVSARVAPVGGSTGARLAPTLAAPHDDGSDSGDGGEGDDGGDDGDEEYES